MELKQKVEALINDVDNTHRYSMSRIYSAYNEVFGTNETPQSCASCLIRKIKELRQWIESHNNNDVKNDEVKKKRIKKK